MIRRMDKNNLREAAELASLLWRGSSAEELADEFQALLSAGGARIFLLYEDCTPIGFAQCQLRHDYVEGTETSPVGYLEGVFVKEGRRRRGYGRALLSACESWAKDQGCREFASDCGIENGGSFHFHQAAGFSEAGRIICFTKKL